MILWMVPNGSITMALLLTSTVAAQLVVELATFPRERRKGLIRSQCFSKSSHGDT